MNEQGYEDLCNMLLNEACAFLLENKKHRKVVKAVIGREEVYGKKEELVNLDTIMMFGMGPRHSFNELKERLTDLSQRAFINCYMGGWYSTNSHVKEALEVLELFKL